MKDLIRKIKKWWKSRSLYVIADPSDNSITLPPELFSHMKSAVGADNEGAAQVFVFKIKGENQYAFMPNPELSDTQLCNIQYNEKYRCIGFETICPSVGRIVYDYDLDVSKKARLKVETRQFDNNKVFYLIKHPYDKSAGYK